METDRPPYYCPSPEEIRRATAAIQESWTASHERLAREGEYRRPPYTIPQVRGGRESGRGG
jgi:hypothetical protein